MEKNEVNRVFPTFSRTCLFLLLTLSLLCSSHFFSSPLWLFPPLLFYLSILSEVWLLNFFRWCSDVNDGWEWGAVGMVINGDHDMIIMVMIEWVNDIWCWMVVCNINIIFSHELGMIQTDEIIFFNVSKTTTQDGWERTVIIMNI